MFHRIFPCGVVAVATLILGPASARATIFSGNPVLDGWLAGGRSNHVGPDPGFPNGAFAGAAVDNAGPIAEYQVYSHTTTLTQSFLDGILAVCPVQCSVWAVGDTIVGLGAVFPNDATGGNQSPATLVVKWGVSASAYTLSSDLLGLNAIRNHEAGEGGVGSVLAELNFAGAGSTAPTAAFQWTGTQNLALQLAGTFIAFRSIVDGQFSGRSKPI